MAGRTASVAIFHPPARRRQECAAASQSAIERVVVINDFSVPEGGAGVLALEAVKQYRRLGYPVSFLTGQGATAELEAMGVSVTGLDGAPLLQTNPARAMMQGLHNARAQRLIAEWIGRHDTPRTVYHLHNWAQILSPAVFAALRPVDGRTIVTCHDFFNICPNGGFLHYGRFRPCQLRPLSAACILSQCDRRNALHKYWRIARQAHLNRLARFRDSRFTFSFIHERMRRKFVDSGFPARRLLAIPNPAQPWSLERIRAEGNASFLFVGRMGSDKGADIALRAARLAGAPITMVGSGEAWRDLAAAYPEARFEGWCDRARIRQIARGARALIVPSRVIEPFGLVICEAAMSGLPVILSDRAYLAPEVEARGFGHSFSVSDIEGLAATMKAVMGNDLAVERMSRNAFEQSDFLCHTPEGWISAFVRHFRCLVKDDVPNVRKEIEREQHNRTGQDSSHPGDRAH